MQLLRWISKLLGRPPNWQICCFGCFLQIRILGHLQKTFWELFRVTINWRLFPCLRYPLHSAYWLRFQNVADRKAIVLEKALDFERLVSGVPSSSLLYLQAVLQSKPIIPPKKTRERLERAKPNSKSKIVGNSKKTKFNTSTGFQVDPFASSTQQNEAHEWLAFNDDKSENPTTHSHNNDSSDHTFFDFDIPVGSHIFQPVTVEHYVDDPIPMKKASHRVDCQSREDSRSNPSPTRSEKAASLFDWILWSQSKTSRGMPRMACWVYPFHAHSFSVARPFSTTSAARWSLYLKDYWKSGNWAGDSPSSLFSLVLLFGAPSPLHDHVEYLTPKRSRLPIRSSSNLTQTIVEENRRWWAAGWPGLGV